MFSEEGSQEYHETDVNNNNNDMNSCDANPITSNSIHSTATTSSSIEDNEHFDIQLQHSLHHDPQQHHNNRQSNNKKDKKKRNSSLHDSSLAKRNYYKSNFRNSMISNSVCNTIFSLDELIVNYKDVCIYGRDLRLFEEDGEWLNDTCINFHLKHIEGIYTRHDDILLMDPAVVSFFMHQCDDDDEINDFAAGYNDFRYPIQRVFIPINDTMKPSTSWQTAGLGTHWSLLLMIIKNEKKNRNEVEAINRRSSTNTKDYSLLDRSYCIIPEDDSNRKNDDNEVDVVTLQFYHYDSISGMNHIAARSVAWKWSLLLLMRLGSIESRENATKLAGGGVKEVSVIECHVPNQKNGYDCGIHVLITIESLLYHNTYEDYIIQQQQQKQEDEGNDDDHSSTKVMRTTSITTTSRRNDRQNSITLHDIMSPTKDNQQNELKNAEDDDDNEEYFYQYGVNQILIKTLQINSDYCRTVRNRIATNIRYLVKTTTKHNNNKTSSLLESDCSNDDIDDDDDPNISSDDNFGFSEIDDDDNDSDVEEDHDNDNYC